MSSAEERSGNGNGNENEKEKGERIGEGSKEGREERRGIACLALPCLTVTITFTLITSLCVTSVCVFRSPPSPLLSSLPSSLFFLCLFVLLDR